MCAFSVGLGAYYTFDKTSKLTAPFSYMYIAQDNAFNQNVDDIIRRDEAHPIIAQMTIPVLETKEASKPEILPERMIEADKTPLKVVSIDQYNQVATAALSCT